ncbi:MAG: TIGR00730 family Rossman fold protein [Paracoccaceae bacterium]
MKHDKRRHPFRESRQDIERAREVPDTPQTRSSAYRLAFADGEFLCRDELRPVRLQLELLKPQMMMDEAGIVSTIVMFGSARIADPEREDPKRDAAMQSLSRYYSEARELARLMTLRSVTSDGMEDVIITGGGPGVMEAGSRGAAEAGGTSIGLNIVLPHEQAPNAYVTPELCFNFHYFAIRKMHFLMRAKAVVVFPGGFGTLDETFEALTLIQTKRMDPVPFLLFGEDYWRKIVNWEALVEAGTISRQDLDLFKFVETAGEAVAAIDGWWD